MTRGPTAGETLSPNHDARRTGAAIDMLVLHYTGMADPEAALDRLRSPEAKVSAHWFVHTDGRVVPLVDETRRAWHAGVSHWAGEDDVNSRSVGIEIHNPGHDLGYPAFPVRQIDAVIALCRDIVARHPISARQVLAHSDVAPGRKIDPGEKFPWDRLHEAGIGNWVAPVPETGGAVLGPGAAGDAVLALQAGLAAYGYGLSPSGLYDTATREVVAAFQRHFRPARVDGLADPATRETLARLADEA